MKPAADGGLAIGTILDAKYRIEGVIGRGGMGMVYRAHHLALNEPVAMKVLRRDALTDEEAMTRFLREAQWAVKLRSEHVARIHDVGTSEDGLPFIVMEYLEGADLGELVDKNGPMYAPIAVDLVMQACDALAEAHSLGIVHRDVKPTNLYVSFRPDETAIVKVLDFGISKAAGGTDLSLTQTQSMLGTPAYMSPEQMRSARDVDQRTDIWSLGTVLYEIVEGRRPFAAESFSEMCVMVAVDPPIPMSSAPELEPVIARCLAKHPDQRYANVAELMADLAAFANNSDAARFYLTRAQRVLGLQAATRDSQTAVPRPSVANLGSGPTPHAVPIAALTMHRAGKTPAPLLTTTGATYIDVTPVPRKKRGVWIGALLAILVGVGGAVAYVGVTKDQGSDDSTSLPAVSGSAEPTTTTDPSSETHAVGPPETHAMPPEAAGSGSAEPPIAAGSGSDAGSGSATQTATVLKRPVKKPPVKRPLVKKPPVVVKPPVTTPPTVTKPKCDPFDSRVKC